MIGLVKNRSEDLIRQVSTRFPDNRSDLKEQFLRYLQASKRRYSGKWIGQEDELG